jgi:hypothetical protein
MSRPDDVLALRTALARALASARPASADTLWRFVRLAYGLAVPRRAVCPGHAAPWTYLERAILAPGRDLVVWACRGGAKTELGSVAAHLDALLHPGIQTRILGGSLDQSEKMYEYLLAKWTGPFARLLARPPTARRTELVTGSVIEVLAQSPRSVRGQRVHRLKCDEVDEFAPDVWQAAQFVTQSGPGADGAWIPAHMEVFSTMHRPFGPMARLVDALGAGAADASSDGNRARDAFRARDVSRGSHGPCADALSRVEPRPARPRDRAQIDAAPNERRRTGDGSTRVVAPEAGSRDGAGDGARECPATYVAGSHVAGSNAAPPKSPLLLTWCLWEVIEKCTPDRSCSRCALAPDCGGRAREAEGYFPIDDALAARARASREAWESEMLCLRPRTDGRVFPGFDPARHVAPVAWSPDAPLYRALDFGYANPFVCLWVQVAQRQCGPRARDASPARDVSRGSRSACSDAGPDFAGVQVRVLAEYVARERPIAHHARVMAARDPGPVTATYADPAGWQRSDVTGTGPCLELGRMGIRVRTPRAGILEGVELVRRLLKDSPGGPGLVIDPRCTWLIRAMQEYHWDENPDGLRGERPAKDGPDHAIDALRYLVTGLFARLPGAARPLSEPRP